MTRTIKATEIKEGMTVQFQVEVDFVREHRDWVTFFRDDGRSVGLDGDIEVKVLSEPQPEEPTAFGARVVAAGYEFLLSNGGRRPWKARLDGNRYSWAEVCGLGPVTIIDADPSWTAPAGREPNPEVPDRIEVWPEDDEYLRNYEWLDTDGHAWRWHWAEDGWGYNHATFPQPFPECFPMTRVADA